MVNAFVRHEDMDSEMTVARNEWEAGENRPFGVFVRRTTSLAYLWHGYGRSTIGARSDLESVPFERLQALYRRYYQPDNAFLVVSGSFDEAQTLPIRSASSRRAISAWGIFPFAYVTTTCWGAGYVRVPRPVPWNSAPVGV
jgi:hypothetical protein